ncbi:MAG: hypothetical protein ABJF50_20090 [Paracoccaceae bacterium]
MAANESNLEVVLAAPGDRDDLVAELYYKDKFLLQVSLDDHGKLIVELPEKTDNWKYIAKSAPYELLIEGLALARKRLEQ